MSLSLLYYSKIISAKSQQIKRGCRRYVDQGTCSCPLSLSLSLYIYIYICTSVTNFFQAKELDANTETYIELLAKGTGKPKEEIAKDTQRPKYLQAQEAIEYGLADKIINKEDSAFEKRVTFHSSLFLRSFKDSSPMSVLIIISLLRIMMSCLLNQEL